MDTKALLQSITALSLSISTFHATAQTLTPFSTNIRNFAYVGKTGYNANVARITLHLSTNPSQYNGGFDTGRAITFTNSTAQDLNAAGINRHDGFLYAMEYLYAGPTAASAKFYRVGTNAVAEQIGIIPGPSSSDAGRTITYSYVNLASGTVDSAGHYWFTAFTYTDMNAPLNAGKVDLFLGELTGLNNLNASTTAVLTPTYHELDISDTILQRGLTNLMTQQAAMIAYGLPPTNADGGWQDMDIHPSNSITYSYIGFPSAPSTVGNNPYPKPPINSYLVRIDKSVTPWKIVPVNTTPNTNPNREEDGAYFDNTGNFYVGFTDGQYSRVNLSSGALDTVTQSSLPLYQSNLRGDFATNAPLISTPLPITLFSFAAKSTSAGNEVDWSTAVELQMSHFELQRSADGKGFKAIATIAAKGSNSRYRFLDAEASGEVYYRLRMIGTSGEEQFSNIIQVTTKENTQPTSIYPTVVTDGIIHVLTPSSGVHASVYNLIGQPLQTTSLETANATEFRLPASLSSGSYIIQITDSQSGEKLHSSLFFVP